MTRKEAARAVMAVLTLGADPAAARNAAKHLAENVTMRSPRGEASGVEAVLALLRNEDLATRFFSHATWAEPETQGADVMLVAKLPVVMPIGGIATRLNFDRSKRVSGVTQTFLPAAPLEPSPLRLTEDIAQAVNNALTNGVPIVVAYVDPQGQPHISPRGTVQVFSSTQLALWNRSAEGGMTKAMATNPRLSFFYRNPATRTTYSFEGHARVTENQAERNRIFEASLVIEQRTDPERKGVALIVDLDRVQGTRPQGRVLMERQGAPGRRETPD